MNEHKIRITANDQPTVLERLLQVTRYRGFIVTGMTMFPHGDDDYLDVELSVRSEQSVERLQQQLNKLIDIREISVDNTSTQQCRA